MALPNGDQHLGVDAALTLDFLLGLEPVVYIDRVSGDCGPLELPFAAELLRRHWNRIAVPPARVAALNAELASAAPFPHLRTLKVRERSLSTLTGRLALTADLKAVLYFVYNGKPVDSTSLHAASSPASDSPEVRRLRHSADTSAKIRRISASAASSWA